MEEGVVARVLHDFFTTADGELSITKGQIVQVLKKVDKYWCYVLSSGKLGNVPTNNLIVVNTPSISEGQELFVAHANFHSPQAGDLSFSKGDLIVGLREVDTNWWEGEIEQRIGIFPVSYTWKLDSTMLKAKEKSTLLNLTAQVKMSMTAKLDDEMDLIQGDIVTITEIIDKNWYRGVCGDRSGTFPSAYVEIITNPLETTDQTETMNINLLDQKQFNTSSNQYCNSSIIDTPEIPPLISFSPEKEVKRSATTSDDLQNLFNDDYFKLNMPTVFQQESKSENVHPINQKEPDHTEKSKNMNVFQSQASVELDIVPYGLTLYPFYEQFENELSFHEGQIVNLIRHVDQFWMEGTIDGKKGIFPTNYVDIVVDCEEQPKTYADPPSSMPQVLVQNSFASVLYNFDAQMDCDLSVSENQVVLILIQMDDDWCKVQDRKGNVGLCPRNHLTAHSTRPGDRHSMALTTTKDDDNMSLNAVKLQRSLSVSNERAPLHMPSPEVKRVRASPERRPSFDRIPHRPAPPTPVPGQKPVRRVIRNQPLPCKDLSDKSDMAFTEGTTVQEEKMGFDEREEIIDNTDAKLEECRKKNLEQRQNVISELVFTEKEYVKDLKITYETFNLHNPSILEARGIDVKAVFGNILEVMHQAETFLDSLQLAMKGKDDDQQCIGPCFLKIADQMKNVYGEYCMNHDHALTLLEKYEGDQEIHNLFEKGLETLRYQIACFNMGSILIKPVQRILKYPLILNELIKCTDKCHQDLPVLIEAVKTMTQVATYINECKRRKDIVSKYLVDGNATITSKMSKISLHSVAKKSSRLGVLLTSTLGFGIATKDPVFDEYENMFHMMVKTISTFVRNVEGLLNCLHEEMMMELDIAQCIAHFYQEANLVVDQFQKVQSMVNTHFWPQFKQMVDTRVETPLSMLLELFQGPSILVQKRHDKLLDYDGCLAKAEKNKENRMIQEELFAAKNNYEALNSHLLEELPLLIQLATELFIKCLGEFITARKLLSGKVTKQYLSLMEMPVMKCSQGDPLETFAVKHSLVLNQYARFTFTSKNLKTDTLTKKVNQKSPTPSLRSSQSEPINLQSQSLSQQAYLKSRYAADAIHRVVQPHTANQPLELTVAIGHLVAVIKKQNPMGDLNLWYVDDGAVQGFLPSRCLELMYNNETLATPSSSRNEVTWNPPSRSDTTSLTPTPVPSTSRSDAESDAPPSYEQVVDPNLYSEIADNTQTPTYYAEIPEDGPVVEFYYAMFDFQGDTANALSIKTGQVLSVVTKQDLQGNQEWWFVEDRFGAKGYVPGNFLSKYKS